jgi:hypothetical protein
MILLRCEFQVLHPFLFIFSNTVTVQISDAQVILCSRLPFRSSFLLRGNQFAR